MAKDKEAEKDDKETDAEGDAGSGGASKKKIIIFAGVGLLLVILSIGGTLFLLTAMNEEDSEMQKIDAELNAEKSEQKASSGASASAIYIPIKPPFIVNFQARGRQRFLQVDVSLMSRDNDAINAVQVHMPLIRNALVLLFGSQSYAELQTVEGKEELRGETLKEVQKIIQAEIGKTGIEEVFFTSFVMQ